MNTINIACKGTRSLSLDEFTPFQGQLKDLSDKQFASFRKELVEHGVNRPMLVWLHKETNFVLDGHQMLRVLLVLRDKEHFVVPALPVVDVVAASRSEAKRKLLGLASVYGRVNSDGLYEYLHDAELDVSTIESISIPEFKLSDFRDEYVEHDKVKREKTPKVLICPNCNHSLMLD